MFTTLQISLATMVAVATAVVADPIALHPDNPHYLHDFLHSVDFIHMKPDASCIKGGVPPNGGVRVLVSPGKAIALYLRAAEPGATALNVELTAGTWFVEWVSPKTGNVTSSEDVVGGGVREIKLPTFQGAIAGHLKHR